MENKRNWKVDDLIDNMLTFKDEAILLREFCLQTALIEDRKWGQPCYTYQGKNVVVIGAFKNYICLSFFKGALIQDPKGLLTSPGENSKTFKQFKFNQISEIHAHKMNIIAFIKQAIEIEKSGLKIKYSRSDEQSYPPQLVNLFNENPSFKQAFESLTPGRKRGYLIHFNQTKKPETVKRRIEKNMPKIFDKKGLNE